MSSTDPSTRTPEGEPPTDDDLAHDVALLEALVEEGCAGPLWEQTVRRLAALGIGTLHSLIRGGGLLRASTALGRPIRLGAEELAALDRDDHERSSVVHEAVVKGLDLFRCRTVMGGVWSPAGGARLDTYFVNGCVGALANPIRRWALAHRDDLADPCAPDELDRALEDVAPGGDPADELLDHEDTAAVLDWLGPVLGKAALLKILTGRSWAEIAPLVGLSPKALERRLRRFGDHHDPDDPRDLGACDD